MNVEKLKTVTLIILVTLSLILTYFLWTFQPHYEQLDHLETVEKVVLSEERTMSEVFAPLHVYFHDEGNHHGLYNSEHFSPVYDLLLEGSFANFETQTLDNRLNDLVEREKSIDFVYPHGLSMEVFQQLFNFNREDPVLSNIERIILFEKGVGDGMQTFVWFISNTNNLLIEAEVKNQALQAYVRAYEQQQEHASELEKVNIGSTRNPIYFPKNEITTHKYQAYPVPLSEHDLTRSLFPDPGIVRESYHEQGIRSYTDGNRELKLSLTAGYLTYINPTRRGDRVDLKGESHLLQAHRFVNSHGGFIEPYRFMNTSRRLENRTQVDFHMLFNGHPTFDAEIARMKVTWQQQEVYEYERSNETISDSITYEEPEAVHLLSAKQLTDILKRSTIFDENDISNITLGYTVSTYDDYIVFTPNWYVFYKGKWEVILTEDETEKEAKAHGLGPYEDDLYRHVFHS